MTFDFITTTAVAGELRAALTPGRVQQAFQVDANSYALEVYAGNQRRYLLLSADQQRPRVHLLSDEQRPRRGVDTPSPLLQLLRKFVRGAILTGVSQPPWERVLWLHFDHSQFGRTALVIELIGRWSNLLLLREARPEKKGKKAHQATEAVEVTEDVDLWRILECVHRHRPQDGARRPALPGQLYTPPPAQEGWRPDELTELRLRLLLEQTPPDATVWRALLDGLLGVSPLLAREIVFRATGDAQIRAGQVARMTPLLEAVAALVDILHGEAWQPCLAFDADGSPVAFAPYRLTHRVNNRLEDVASISLAAEQFYAQRSVAGDDAYGAARRQVAATIDRVRRGLERRRESIGRQLRSPEEIDRLRVSGEWILALSSTIEPRQTELRLPDDTGLPPVALDPMLSPADNAARYFKRYGKSKRARQYAEPRLAEVEAELAYVEQLAADLALAGDRNEIDAVRAQLAEDGYLRQPRTRIVNQPKGPRYYTSLEGFAIVVGRNSRQNERVTFDIATPDDLWLHARGLAGSHVVVRSGGRSVSDATVQQAAELAAYFSRGRGEAWVDVIVTTRRHVRRAPGGHPGMVMVDGETVVTVRPPSNAEEGD